MLFLAMTTVGFSQNVDLEHLEGFVSHTLPAGNRPLSSVS